MSTGDIETVIEIKNWVLTNAKIQFSD